MFFFFLLSNQLYAKKCGFKQAQKVTTLDPSPLSEISGGAYVSEGTYWVLNDSEKKTTPPTFYEITPEEGLIHSWELIGISQDDWEDMDVWSSPNEGTKIYIAETGGNNKLKDTFNVYSFPIPSTDETKIQPSTTTLSFEEFGPRDFESFAIDPQTGKWYFLSKGWWTPSQFFTVNEDGKTKVVANFSKKPIMKTSKELRQHTPESIGRLQPSSKQHRKTIMSKVQWYRTLPYFPTSMDFSPDGYTLFVRTYMFGYTWEREENETWPDVLKNKPCRIILPVRKSNVQGETVFFDNYGQFIYLISENDNTPHPVYKIERNKRKYQTFKHEK